MSIKEIAKLANVAPSTVSRVLNDSGYVSEEVRERVKKVVREQGYVPNAITKSFRYKRTNVLGVIIPKIDSEPIARYISSITEVSKSQGYELLFACSNMNSEDEIKQIDLLSRQNVDGIILISTGITDQHAKSAELALKPIVLLGQNHEKFISVSSKDFESAFELTNLMIDKDRKKLALINLASNDPAVNKERLHGFTSAMDKARLEVRSSWISESGLSERAGYEAMKKIWNNSDEKPTAVFCVADVIAIGALSFLLEEGVKVPKQCMIAGVDNSSVSASIHPPLTTIDLNLEILANTATNLLIDKINGKIIRKSDIPQSTYEIIERSTT